MRADHAWAIQLINSTRYLGDILAPNDRFCEQSVFCVRRFDDLQSSCAAGRGAGHLRLLIGWFNSVNPSRIHLTPLSPSRKVAYTEYRCTEGRCSRDRATAHWAYFQFLLKHYLR